MPNKTKPLNRKSSNRKKARESIDKVILILGAPGLVGAQVTRQVARELCPDQIILASLSKSDFGTLVTDVKNELHELVAEAAREGREIGKLCDIEFTEVVGNIFVRYDLASQSSEELKADAENRRKLYEDLFGPLNAASQRSMLVSIIQKYHPDVIIDCINTATGISYQDVDTSCKELRQHLDEVEESLHNETAPVPQELYKKIENAVEMLLISQSIPQIVRHIQLLHNAMVEHETRLYIKVGTTGTGGMGLNIPYTHGEDKPSAKLMAKSSIGFAHTGLMFLMARTPKGPIVKEIKPGAMIGYKKVDYQPLRKQHKEVFECVPKEQDLTHELILKLAQEDYVYKAPIRMVGIDTGENGFFARGEFEAVTSINQMEFVTPEEIAHAVILEINGGNTGHDVISALDGSVMPPSYRAGYLRGSAIESLRTLEKAKNSHSVATGELGPPKLTKLLYEAHLLYLLARGGSVDPPKLQMIIDKSAEDISNSLEHMLQGPNKDLCNTIISIGIPILLMDGKTLLRGPHIKVPESADTPSLSVTDERINEWAEQGWVDLRPENIREWQKRFRSLLKSAETIHLKGSAEITMEAYRSDEIRIGEVVGWIFNNEEKGYRNL